MKLSLPTPAPLTTAALLAAALAMPAMAQQRTQENSLMDGRNGYSVAPLFTVGESVNGYQPVGLFDGLGAFRLNDQTVRVLANHELSPDKGYAYSLANGTQLTGARVSYFDLRVSDGAIVGAGQAINTVYDRRGHLVTSAQQINELGADADPTAMAINGFNRFCSARLVEQGQFGFRDTIFFSPEETSTVFGHPHGGTFWATDVEHNTTWAAPALGRGTWENLTPVDIGDPTKTALILGDDFGSGRNDDGSFRATPPPLYLYVGDRSTADDATFLQRNGLADGQLYVWVNDNPLETNPDEGFVGSGQSRDGRFVKLDGYFRPDLAGTEGYDDLGYADDTVMRDLAAAQGAYLFSRPEDVNENPNDPSQVVLASTGREGLFPSDSFGSTYVIDLAEGEFDPDAGIVANINILNDGDETTQAGIRSPDNLTWSPDGTIFVQEDAAVEAFAFAQDSTAEAMAEDASIWQIDPATGGILRVAQVNRAMLPEFYVGEGSGAGTFGDWESSGIIDVSALFGYAPGELFLFDVQAHTLEGGIIDRDNLVEGGQLAFLAAPGVAAPIPTPAALPAGLALLSSLLLRRRREA